MVRRSHRAEQRRGSYFTGLNNVRITADPSTRRRLQDTEYSHRNFMELYGCIIMFYVWDYGNDIEHYPSNIHEPAFLIKQHFWNQEPTPLDI